MASDPSSAADTAIPAATADGGSGAGGAAANAIAAKYNFRSTEVKRIFSGLFGRRTEHGRVPGESAPTSAVVNVFEAIEREEFGGVAALVEADRQGALIDGSKILEIKDAFNYKLLHRLCVAGHLDTVKLLIDYGASVKDQNNQDDASPLHLAVLSGNAELVEYLIAQGSDVNAGGGILQPGAQFRPLGMQTTPLHIAAGENMAAVCRLLLSRGANVEALDAAKETPLFKSCALGAADAAAVLLEGDANPNAARQDNGNTCLQMTVSRNHPELTRLLIRNTKRKVDVNCPDHKGDTALWKAAERGHVDCVRALLEDKEIDLNYSPSHNSITALHGAASRNHPEVVRLLLEQGADVDKRERQGCTALLMASLYGATECVKVLLEFNADVNAKAANGGTALQAAAFKNRPEILKILLDHNANPNDYDFQGDTALLKAAGVGATKCIEYLLQSGANVDAARPYNPNKGATALHCAAGLAAILHPDKKIYPDIIYMLLKHGANADLKCEINGQLFTALGLINIVRQSDPSISPNAKFYKLLKEKTMSSKSCPCSIM